MKKTFLMRCLSTMVLLTVAFSTIGCSQFDSVIPNLTNEEESLVIEYAAETLLKYDNKKGDKIGRQPEDFIIDKSIIEGTPADLEPTPTPEDPAMNLQLPDANDAENTEAVLEENVPKTVSMEEAVGLPAGVSLSYTGYEILDRYPYVGDNNYFAVGAATGNKLLVLEFDLTNNGAESASIDIPSNNIRFKIVLNDESRNALTTMLLDDLAFFKETLEPGSTQRVVIVGEYPEEKLADIQSLGMSVKTETDLHKIVLNPTQ